VNPIVVDVKISFKYPKTPRKMQKINNVLKTKRLLIIKTQAKGSLTVHLSCQWTAFVHAPRQLRPVSIYPLHAAFSM